MFKNYTRNMVTSQSALLVLLTGFKAVVDKSSILGMVTLQDSGIDTAGKLAAVDYLVRSLSI